MKRRAIKFRVWNNKTKSWVHGPGQEPHLFGETILLGGFMQGVPLLDLDDCVPLQFTGMLDKNGVEIYEGDIISYGVSTAGKYARSFAPVVFSPFGYGFVLDSSGRHKIGDTEYGDYVPLRHSEMTNMTYEVVGNIYENPELL